jgi:hypothetical protein
MKCKFCGEDRKLCQSHVIPEFFYTPLYDDQHLLHAHYRESGKVKFAQKGHREPLLCEECETLLNDRYEKYFKKAWYDDGALPRTPNFQQGAITGLDYRPFKPCLLSILWRASVASQHLFSRVDLGTKHERTVRQMLIDDDPGPEELYPIAVDVLWLKDYVVRSAIVQPVDRRYDHKRVYLFAFGGCIWWFLIGSETEGMFRSLSIRKDGTLPIVWQNFAKLQIVRDFLAVHSKAVGRPRK